jgi:hypothetical protein
MCGRTADYERECKVKEIKAKLDEDFHVTHIRDTHGIASWGGNPEYRLKLFYS